MPRGEDKKRESDLGNEAMIWVSQQGGFLHRNNVGEATTKNGWYIKYGLGKGSPDYVGMTDFGQFLGIEIKQPKESTKAHQSKWLRMADSKGALVGVIRNMEDLRRLWARRRTR